MVINNKYLIGIDSDGTLRHSDGTISPETKKIIKKIINQENIIVICTARPRYHTKKISEEVGANHYLISSNGTEIFDNRNNKVIWGVYLSSSACKKIYEDTLKLNLRAVFVCENVEYATQIIRNDHQILLNEKNVKEVLSKNIKQIMIIGKEKEKIKEYRKKVTDEYHFNVVDTSNDKKNEIWFSIINKKASKGMALKQLANYIKIPIENIIAIGNDTNDLSMIKIAKIKVAMANATPDLKKEANVITKSNDEDGVYNFLKDWEQQCHNQQSKFCHH